MPEARVVKLSKRLGRLFYAGMVVSFTVGGRPVLAGIVGVGITWTLLALAEEVGDPLARRRLAESTVLVGAAATLGFVALFPAVDPGLWLQALIGVVGVAAACRYASAMGAWCRWGGSERFGDEWDRVQRLLWVAWGLAVAFAAARFAVDPDSGAGRAVDLVGWTVVLGSYVVAVLRLGMVHGALREAIEEAGPPRPPVPVG